MKNHQFKTNINCSGCIAKATDKLNEIAGKDQWQVDTLNPEKILTITNEEVPAVKIIEAVKSIGFRIEEITPNRS